MRIIFNNMVFPNPIEDGAVNYTIGDVPYNTSIETGFTAEANVVYLISVVRGTVSSDTRLFRTSSAITKLSQDNATTFTTVADGMIKLINKDSTKDVEDLVLQVKPVETPSQSE